MTERGKRKRRAKLRSREGGCDENMTIHDIHRRGPYRRTGSSLAMLPLVMPGLVPGISIGAIAAAERDARNKSGHDEEWVGMPGADPCPDPTEPFEILLNPCHAPCPPELNRTAVEQVRA